MVLQVSRSRVIDAIENKVELNAIKPLAESWFADLKVWEGQETFQRAFQDTRMTARAVKADSQMTQIKLKNTAKTKINLDPSIEGVYARMDAANFLNKLKNDKGLHDLSAVLLHPAKLISKQLFNVTPDSKIIFMPLPLEEDLVTFALLSVIAKSHRTSALYNTYVTMRANFTRIKYGAMTDMQSGFLTISQTKFDSPLKDDGRVHVRYGMGNLMGGSVQQGVLGKRAANALKYKSLVATPKKQGENNEVVISYRNHAGPFPMIGTSKSAPPNSFELANKTDKWTLRDDGSLSI
jgi:hypothetical protein